MSLGLGQPLAQQLQALAAHLAPDRQDLAEEAKLGEAELASHDEQPLVLSACEAHGMGIAIAAATEQEQRQSFDLRIGELLHAPAHMARGLPAGFERLR